MQTTDEKIKQCCIAGSMQANARNFQDICIYKTRLHDIIVCKASSFNKIFSFVANIYNRKKKYVFNISSSFIV